MEISDLMKQLSAITQQERGLVMHPSDLRAIRHEIPLQQSQVEGGELRLFGIKVVVHEGVPEGRILVISSAVLDSWEWSAQQMAQTEPAVRPAAKLI